MESLSTPWAKRGSISRQIAGRMAVGAVLVTLLSLLAFGLLDYRDRVQAARNALDEIAQSAAPGIAGSLWGFDMAQLQVIADGLTRIPSIGHVLVLDEKGVEVARSGHGIGDPDRRLEKRVDLVYRDPAMESRVGELRVVVDLWPLKVAAVERLLPLLIALLLVVTALGAVFYALFERSVARHLMAVSDYLSGLSLDRLDKPLTLPSPARLDNELGVVVEAINGMREHIRAALKETTQAKERLATSERWFRLFMDNSPTSAWVMDAEGRIPYLSRTYYQMFGVPDEDLEGSHITDFYPPDLSDVFLENNRRVLKEKKVIETIEPCLRPDGSLGQYLIYKFPLAGPDGEPLVGGIAADITELKRAEQELATYREGLEQLVAKRTADLERVKDAAEAANRAKSLFLANMSHELRTPLNAILGFSDLVRRSPGLSEIQQANLAVIHKSGDHLLGLINDVLDLAKIEAGRTQIERAPFDLADLIGGVADMMRVRALEKGLELRIDQPPDFPRHVIDDQAKLRQILINLLSNAVKATERGGVALRLGVEPGPAERLILEVEDTGIGIAPEDQSRIFEAFVQSSGSGKWHGTGLGLAITRQFIALMGGRLTLASEVGKGSTFRVDLPLRRARPEDPPEAIPERGEVIGLEPGQPDYRVLVVDDNLENRLLLNQLLAGVGYAVREAENGAEAVARYRDWQPHFIWMDRRMPVMDGVDATCRIRALPGGGAVTIAAVTASSFKQDDAILLESGFDAIVHKPFRPEEIHECMEALLGVKLVRAAPAVEGACELAPQSLDALPEPLRQALAEAITSLDGDRIKALLAEIGESRPALAAALGRLADNYDYQPILDLLERASVTAAKP